MLSCFQLARDLKKILGYAFLILPPYALGGGLLDLTTNQVLAEIMEEYGNSNAYAVPLEWNVIGANVAVLFLEALIFHILNLLIEYKWLQCLKIKR